jgi:hypothetical protein
MTDDSPRRPVTLTITGDFNDGELGAFVALVRSIDGRNPERHYAVIIDDPQGKLADMEPAMRNVIVPEVPSRTTTFSVHRKQ